MTKKRPLPQEDVAGMQHLAEELRMYREWSRNKKQEEVHMAKRGRKQTLEGGCIKVTVSIGKKDLVLAKEMGLNLSRLMRGAILHAHRESQMKLQQIKEMEESLALLDKEKVDLQKKLDRAAHAIYQDM